MAHAFVDVLPSPMGTGASTEHRSLRHTVHVSKLQVAAQQSPLLMLPSSHPSPASNFASPQTPSSSSKKAQDGAQDLADEPDEGKGGPGRLS